MKVFKPVPEWVGRRPSGFVAGVRGASEERTVFEFYNKIEYREEFDPGSG